jgi:hypothetical protein
MEENVIFLDVGTDIRIIHQMVMVIIFISLKIKKKLKTHIQKQIFNIIDIYYFFTTSNILFSPNIIRMIKSRR